MITLSFRVPDYKRKKKTTIYCKHKKPGILHNIHFLLGQNRTKS